MAKSREEIKVVEDFSDEASEMYDGFLSTFTVENKLIRMVHEEEREAFDLEGVDFIYTSRGMYLAEKYRSRLWHVGIKYFHEDDIEIESDRIRDI